MHMHLHQTMWVRLCSRYMYFGYMGSNLCVICSRYIVFKWNHMYLRYIFSKPHTPPSPLSYLAHHSPMYLVFQYMCITPDTYIYMYLVWFTYIWDTYESCSPPSLISLVSLPIFVYLVAKPYVSKCKICRDT